MIRFAEASDAKARRRRHAQRVRDSAKSRAQSRGEHESHVQEGAASGRVETDPFPVTSGSERILKPVHRWGYPPPARR